MKLFKIPSKYLEKSGPWATVWANGPLQFSNPKTGPGLGQNDSAQAHSGPNPKIGFTKARARPGWAWAWPKLIPKTNLFCWKCTTSENVKQFFGETTNFPHANTRNCHNFCSE